MLRVVNNMFIAYKYRIYPTHEQKIFISQNSGCSRLVYNELLAERVYLYEEYKKLELDISFSKYLKENNIKFSEVSHLKSKYEFLCGVDSLALANAKLNLGKAFSNFFRDKNVGYPKFKKKKNHQSYTTSNQKNNINIIDKGKYGYIKLPKFKERVKIRYHRKLPSDIRSVTLSKNCTNQYFISILVDCEITKKPANDNIIALDLGIKDFYSDSNYNKISNPKYYSKTEKKIKKLSRELSRKKKGSKNRAKARIRLAKQHNKIANQRSNFIHQSTNKLVNDNQVIVIEDLRIKSMMQDRSMAKAIGDVSWYKFTSVLEYKCKWHDRKLIKAPKYYASSQLCSECGYKNKEVKSLSVREWQCKDCDTIHDRDFNASQNLLKLASTVGMVGIV